MITAIVKDGRTVLAQFTRPNNTTAYSANQVVGTSPAANLSFSNVTAQQGRCLMVAGVRMRIDRADVPSGMTGFRLHLFSQAPTAIVDGAAFNLPAADRDKYLGFVLIPAPTDLGDTIWAQDDNLNVNFGLDAASTTIYGILETLGGFTPNAQTVITIKLCTIGV